jgi:hypothetical protein
MNAASKTASDRILGLHPEIAIARIRANDGTQPA